VQTKSAEGAIAVEENLYMSRKQHSRYHHAATTKELSDGVISLHQQLLLLLPLMMMWSSGD